MKNSKQNTVSQNVVEARADGLLQFQQLIISDAGTITAEQKQFVDLHKEIMYHGAMAAEHLIRLACSLKQMKDKKLYAVAGFETFGDYAEKAVGFKERQAYNYISTYENLSEEYLQLNASLGITKLSLLAGAHHETREEIIKTVEVESVSVKELQARIKELEDNNGQLTMELSVLEKSAKDNNSAEEIKQANEIIADANSKLSKANKEKEALEKEIASLKSATAKVETVKDPETEANLKRAEKQLEKAQDELARKNCEIEALNKKLATSDAEMTTFKVKFKDLQMLGAEVMALLQKIEGSNQAKCKSALKKMIEGWNL
ncbi:MAG: hypothetical protein FWD49_04695 [Firmicutes bacterium]|nr:hypothetical protein [Bacillota bacterium]